MQIKFFSQILLIYIVIIKSLYANEYINIPCGLMSDNMILKYKSSNIYGYTSNFVDIYSVIDSRRTNLKEVTLYLFDNKPISKMAVTQKLVKKNGGVYILSETVDFPGLKKTRNYYTPLKSLCGKIPKKFNYKVSSKNQLGEDLGQMSGIWEKVGNEIIIVPAGKFDTEVFKSITEYIVTNRVIPSAITRMVNTIYVDKKLGIVKMQFNTSQFFKSDINTSVLLDCNKMAGSFTKELVSYSGVK